MSHAAECVSCSAHTRQHIAHVDADRGHQYAWSNTPLRREQSGTAHFGSAQQLACTNREGREGRRGGVLA